MTSHGSKESIMKLFKDLFFTDYGALSLAVIVFMLGMAWWYLRFFLRKMDQKPGSE